MEKFQGEVVYLGFLNVNNIILSQVLKISGLYIYICIQYIHIYIYTYHIYIYTYHIYKQDVGSGD